MQTKTNIRKVCTMEYKAVLILYIAININLGICDDPSKIERSPTEPSNDEPRSKFPAFGRAMREEFFFEPSFIELNHGSYGPYSKVVAEDFLKHQRRAERNPDLWLRREAKKELIKVRGMLSELIVADPEDFVLIPSTTIGMNSIFRSIVFNPGERILHLSSIFTAIKNLIQFIIDYSNGAVSKVVFTTHYPMSNEEFLEKFEKFLEEETKDPKQPIRIAIIELIPCVPGVRIPVAKVTTILRRFNITVVIDGAHALGQVPINITDLDPDYFVSNGHKWLMTARGTAVLYVKKEFQSSIHPSHINSGYKKSADFQNEFYLASTSTMDFSSYMTVPTALQFRRDLGGEDVIMQYNHNLAYKGGTLMARLFGTQVMQTKDQMGSMIDIQLPLNNPRDPKLNIEWWIDEQLFNNHNIYSSVYFHNGNWWVRAGAQIYNEISDFEKAAQEFLKICAMLNSSQNETTTVSSNSISSTFTSVVN